MRTLLLLVFLVGCAGCPRRHGPPAVGSDGPSLIRNITKPRVPFPTLEPARRVNLLDRFSPPRELPRPDGYEHIATLPNSSLSFQP